MRSRSAISSASDNAAPPAASRRSRGRSSAGISRIRLALTVPRTRSRHLILLSRRACFVVKSDLIRRCPACRPTSDSSSPTLLRLRPQRRRGAARCLSSARPPTAREPRTDRRRSCAPRRAWSCGTRSCAAKPTGRASRTLPPFLPDAFDMEPGDARARSASARRHMKAGKFLVTLGGEHSLTIAPVRAARKVFGKIGVVQFDAHADLRDEFDGTPYSHASVMRRVHDDGVPALGGGHSLTFDARGQAHPASKDLPVIWGFELDRAAEKLGPLLDRLPDAGLPDLRHRLLRPGLVPATGTPEPGGGSWYPTLALLRDAFRAQDGGGDGRRRARAFRASAGERLPHRQADLQMPRLSTAALSAAVVGLLAFGGSSRAESPRTIVRRIFADADVSSGALVLFRNGERIFADGFGERDAPARDHADSDPARWRSPNRSSARWFSPALEAGVLDLD